MEVITQNFFDVNNQINEKFDLWSLQSGLGADQLKFLFCSFIAYPLSIVCSLLPNIAFIKHVYCLILGLAFGWLTMGTQLIHSFASATVAYFIMLTFPAKTSAVLVYVWMMGYLSVSHIYRMYYDYMGYTLDFTGTQMLLTLKLTMLAIDYYDGQKKPEEIKGYAKLMNIKKLPNLLEYYAYVYFYAGLLAGPAFNYKEYIDFADGSLFKDRPNKRMPNPIFPFLKNTVLVVLVAIGVVINLEYNLYYCRTDEYYSHSIIYRFFYIWGAGLLARFPYYFAWKLGEGSCILAGIGYNKTENGVAKWDRATNCKVLGLELAQNFREVTDSWNIRTDRWLKHYIYERVTFSPLGVTFFNSALWHGFYPGYYLSFITASFVVQTARLIRKNIRPHFLYPDESPKKTKILYDFVCTLVTGFTLNYIMSPFVVLGFEYSIRLWSSVYFIGHIAVAITYILCTFVIRAPRVARPTTTTTDKKKEH